MDGSVKTTSATKSAGSALDEIAMEAVRRWMVRQQSGDCVLTVEVEFLIKEDGIIIENGHCSEPIVRELVRNLSENSYGSFTPDYPEEAKKKHLKGVVQLSVRAAAGKPQSIRVVQSAGAVFDNPSIESVKKWEFSKGIEATFQVDFIFEYIICRAGRPRQIRFLEDLPAAPSPRAFPDGRLPRG